MVRGSVGAGDARAVDHERHREAVQRDVARDLVEGALQEGRIDADDRAQPSHRESGGERHRVLLGDADIEEAIREALGELEEAGRRRHRGGDRDDPLVGLGCLAERLAEDVGPVDPLLERRTAVRVERRNPVEFVNLVCNCRAVALALVGDHVHHHRPADPRRVAQRLLDGLEIVPVDRSTVFEPERLEERDRRDQLLERVLHAPGGLVRGVPDRRKRAQRGPGRILGRLVAR